MVLGISWLQRYSLSIDWATGAIVGWSPSCHTHCLKSALPAPGRLPGGLKIAPDLSASSAEYQELWEGFSKAWATSLPQHQPVSKKVKPEALARHYSATATPLESETFPPLEQNQNPLWSSVSFSPYPPDNFYFSHINL